jgi:uncharacterized protein
MKQFEWDELKDRINQRKHGIPFSRAVEFFSGIPIIKPDARNDYNEKRFNAIGISENYIMNVTFTLRNGLIRIISARPANGKEREELILSINNLNERGKH